MGKTWKDHPERRVPGGIKKMRKMNKGQKVKNQDPGKFNWRDELDQQNKNNVHIENVDEE